MEKSERSELARRGERVYEPPVGNGGLGPQGNGTWLWLQMAKSDGGGVQGSSGKPTDVDSNGDRRLDLAHILVRGGPWFPVMLVCERRGCLLFVCLWDGCIASERELKEGVRKGDGKERSIGVGEARRASLRAPRWKRRPGPARQ